MMMRIFKKKAAEAHMEGNVEDLVYYINEIESYRSQLLGSAERVEHWLANENVGNSLHADLERIIAAAREL